MRPSWDHSNTGGKPIPIDERFWDKVDFTGNPIGCWIWLAYKNPLGYGRIGTTNHKVAKAHRVAWELTNGPIPKGMLALHKCDNPPCVNPQHLYLGYPKDNSQDMVKRGRPCGPKHAATGERHWGAKLTWQQVREIRAKYTGRRGQLPELAKEYGMTISPIWAIVHHKMWKESQRA